MVKGQKYLEEEPPKPANKITALQWERLQLWESDSPERRDQVDATGFLEAESHIRELAQVEIGWKERLMDLHNRSDTFGNKKKYASKIKEAEDEILKLSKESWFAERIWWSKRATFYEGPLTRGMELWRSHPAWYMHQVLVQDCAGKGGCCGRGCKCCSERRGKLPGRKFGGGGHCTVFCHCCEKARGFALTEDDIGDMDELYSLDNDAYYGRIMLASLLGLHMDNNHDSPFDLIEDPSLPPYTPPDIPYNA